MPNDKLDRQIHRVRKLYFTPCLGWMKAVVLPTSPGEPPGKTVTITLWTSDPDAVYCLEKSFWHGNLKAPEFLSNSIFTVGDTFSSPWHPLFSVPCSVTSSSPSSSSAAPGCFFLMCILSCWTYLNSLIRGDGKDHDLGSFCKWSLILLVLQTVVGKFGVDDL